MSAGEQDMSDTEIWGPCGHQWINFWAWVTGDLDEGEECVAEAQFAGCDTCWHEVEETITVSALLYDVVGAARGRGRYHEGGRALVLGKVDAASDVSGGRLLHVVAATPAYRLRRRSDRAEAIRPRS
jgi:hypothetical protein